MGERNFSVYVALSVKEEPYYVFQVIGDTVEVGLDSFKEGSSFLGLFFKASRIIEGLYVLLEFL